MHRSNRGKFDALAAMARAEQHCSLLFGECVEGLVETVERQRNGDIVSACIGE